MGFEKGVSGNPNGRPVGSINAVNKNLREMITNFLHHRFNDVEQNFEMLDPKEKLKVYCDLLPYALSKLQGASGFNDSDSDNSFLHFLKRTSVATSATSQTGPDLS
jgi:hypothetical protein